MTTPRIVRNERGQMTIFIALIFQVLFVFFAMIINVGLIVHDKINLQNSVDLAAYYGAQRQAEVLNAIAHENYQIRQAWKLLAWRVRVLGDMGYKGHPLQNISFDNSNSSVSQIVADAPFSNSASPHYPVVCVNHGAWDKPQNLCVKSEIIIPNVPVIPTIAGFLPWNIVATNKSKELSDIASTDCKGTGPANFTISAFWMGAYRAQVAQAKQAIRIYATNLANGLDIRGDSINAGAQKTFMNNLTRANSIGINPTTDLHFSNSLTGEDPKSWLHEVAIRPSIYYADFYTDNGKGGCNGITRLIAFPPQNMKTVPPDLLRMTIETGNPDDPYNSSFGFEKNPWMMVYYRVEAKSTPRKPYLPFGDAIPLNGLAYAKPFGGRIGPWYYNTWPKGSNKSAGNFTARIDNLMPVDSDSAPSGAALSPEMAQVQIPNYSRYPGDQLGLMSAAGVLLFGKSLVQNIISPANKGIHAESYSAVPSGSDGLAYAWASSPLNTASVGNFYSGVPWIRQFEVAAIAPDLFDVTYYSIDPKFYFDYIQQGGAKLFSNQIPYDIGSFEGQVLNVKDEVGLANQLATPGIGSWLIAKWENLLTGWMPSNAFAYDFPTGSFGNCTSPAISSPTPGACAQGGRVGYSVKIVSEQYLKSSNLSLGGPGTGAGAILNPPQD